MCARRSSARTCSLTLDPPKQSRAATSISSRWPRPRKVTGARRITIRTTRTLLQFDAAKDKGEPLTIAASVEKGGSADERVQINSARLVVVANSTFIQDNALTQDQQGLDFVSASINWLLSREQLIGIAPKVPQTLTFTLDERRLRNLRWLILVLLPLVPALIGLGGLVAAARLTSRDMKTRTTLILLLLVVGLGVWIKFFESKKPNTAETQRQAGNVVNFDREKLDGIVIQNGDDGSSSNARTANGG